MEALIDKIVSKLQRLPVSQLQTTLEFVNSLHELGDHSVSMPDDSEMSPEEIDRQQKQAAWEAVVQKTAGAWPDFPTVEEIRAGMGEDVPREPF